MVKFTTNRRFYEFGGGLTEYSEKYVFDFFSEPAILINNSYEKTNIMLSKNYSHP